jgi:aspartate aminotransferase
MVEALRIAAPEKDYLPVRGLPALREAVADFHRRKDQVDAAPEQVLIGPGSKELMFLVQLVFYGEILLPTPAWVSYLPQARILGRRISMLHTTLETNWRITAGQLQRSLEMVGDDSRPRLLVLNYPSNPTGGTYSEAELAEIAEVARKYGVIVLSDEIYGQLHFEGAHVSIARFYPEGTILSSGISKWCGAGGWRLGTFTFPPALDWLANAVATVASETYTSVSAPIQYAAIVAFHGGLEIERYLAHARRVLATLGRQSAKILSDAGLGLHPPTGGFYLFPDFSGFRERLAGRDIRGGQELCDGLLADTGVAILPGVAFGRKRNDLTARLAYVDFDGGEALAASETLPLDQPLPADFTRRHCGRVIGGMERLAEWAARTK